MVDKKEVGKVEIEIDLLRRISEYYEFPMAVFFGDVSMFKDKTRQEALVKKAKEFRQKLNDLVEDTWG